MRALACRALALVALTLLAAPALAGPPRKRQRVVRVQLVLPGKPPVTLFGPSGTGSTVDAAAVRRLGKAVGPGQLVVWLPPEQPSPPIGVLLPEMTWRIADGHYSASGRLASVRLMAPTDPARADVGRTLEGEASQVIHYAFHQLQIDHTGEDGATASRFEWPP